LQSDTLRNYALSPRERVRFKLVSECHNFAITFQLCLGLRVLTTEASSQWVYADAHGPSQPSVSRHVRTVVRAINDVLSHEEIRFPPTLDGRRRLADDFYNVAGFPSVAGWFSNAELSHHAGAIDGTLVDLATKPRVDEADYVDRRAHGHHSLNVVGVCDANNKFLYVNAQWPGGTHDSRPSEIRNSIIRSPQATKSSPARSFWVTRGTQIPTSWSHPSSDII
jgi:hypothetical protein